MVDSLFAEYLPKKIKFHLSKTANKLVAAGKGLLAADETPKTLGIRFKAIELENTPQTRAAYRDMLFSTDISISRYISGIILHPETLLNLDKDETPLIKKILDRRMIPGVKVDTGFVDLAGTFDECTTQGLDNLAELCIAYKKYGCQFAKWRCALKICSQTPSFLALKETSNALARYAVICQQNGLVPLIEPEVLCVGNHSLDVSKYVSETVLASVYKALADHHVYLEGTLLKTNIIRSGHTCCKISSIEENAAATLDVFRRTVPPAVPGVVLLSGGMSENLATLNLNEINKSLGEKPWKLTFSFGRGLQNSVLDAWKGRPENRSNGQCQLIRLSKANSNASLGVYGGRTIIPTGHASIYVASHAY